MRKQKLASTFYGRNELYLRRMNAKTRNTRQNRKPILAIEITEDYDAQLEEILKDHPFTRSRLGFVAFQIGFEELKRRYPPVNR